MTRHDPAPPLPYRGDIDGLRAIAVLSVVLYHFGAPLAGGFVGVDIFFVISGFLIGGILWREFDRTGRVRLGAFYLRRFKRLAPAFFAMAFVTTLVGAAILLPFEFREYGKSLIAATVWLSNVLFYRDAGYFDAASEEKPLLHTWSLAVEEQFYILLPLTILLLKRSRRLLLWALITAWGLSLAASILATPSHPMAAFYLFPFRAWELLSGVLLAIWGFETRRRWHGYAALSWLGLGLVAVSILFIPAGPQFPGVLAILPVLGTVLLIANGTGPNPVNRLLCHPWAVMIGLLSYSLYLWHWPIYVFGAYLRGGALDPVSAAVLIALSLALAWLSWRFVETPVRRARSLSARRVFVSTGLASAAALMAGAVMFTRDGLPGRFGPEARVHIAASGDFLQDFSRCRIAETAPLDGLEICPIGPDGPPQVLIWGDSHLRALHDGLSLAAAEAQVPGLILWRAGCPPLFGVRKTESAATPSQDLDCTRANLQIRQALSRLDTVETVLLVGRWSYYASGTGIGLDATNEIGVFAVEDMRAGQAQAQVVTTAAGRTIDILSQQFPRVAVLRQPPEIPDYDSRRAARETAHAGLPFAADPITRPDVARDALALRAALADAPWLAAAEAGRITWIDPWPRLCDAEVCSALQDGAGQYFDNNHLTNSAAVRLRDLFAPLFEPVTQRTALDRRP
ncbi:acyltransferase family protein [Cognatishimia sp. F0-27]|uniref:acyltransferase family protein n=1 Tax=Cognatishimia sp. F0-27 TaxID=2816855 RepID=UPI001D0C5603|nr:acyltransferase family protein [Cognatishimia sp. F0-27]MCC1491378.1 acyltransferase [Cognatishimia sp. F0-27]